MHIHGFANFEKIGEGAMAEVWKARQISLDRIVAIKVLKGQYSKNPDEVRDFIAEAKIAAQITHPNLIQVYDVGEQDGNYYFVMEYVSGSTVAGIIRTTGPIPCKAALEIILDVANALSSAWNKLRLVHRDIKPDNIMMDGDGIVKVADLGLAKRYDPAHLIAQLQRGDIEGTPNYISPEQATCSPKVDCRSDMYSLGATLFHMVTGQLPYGNFSPMEALHMHVAGQLPNPRDIIPTLPVSVAQLIARLMMKKPHDRFNDWDEAISEIKKVMSGRMSSSPQKSTPSTIKSGGPTGIPTIKHSASTPAPAPSPAAIPSRILGLVWLILLSWWGYLAYSMLQLPEPPPIESLRRPDKLRFPKAKVTLAVPLPPSAQPAGPETNMPAIPNPPPPAPEQPELAQPAPGTPEPGVPAPGAPAPADGLAEESAFLTSFKETIAECIRNVRIDEALAQVKQEQEMKASSSEALRKELAAMEGFLKALQGLPNLLDSNLMKGIGEEVTVRYKGVERPVILRSVDGETVSVDLISAIGAKTNLTPATVTARDVSVKDRLRWLGLETKTPLNACSRYILAMKGGDFAAAEKAAAHCGPFAQVFKLEAQAKQKGPRK